MADQPSLLWGGGFAEGYPQTAALRTVYGPPEAADEAFRKYVKSF